MRPVVASNNLQCFPKCLVSTKYLTIFLTLCAQWRHIHHILGEPCTLVFFFYAITQADLSKKAPVMFQEELA